MGPGGAVLPLALPVALAQQNRHAGRNPGCGLAGSGPSRGTALLAWVRTSSLLLWCRGRSQLSESCCFFKKATWGLGERV